MACQRGCRRTRRAAAAGLQLRRIACRRLYPAGRPRRGDRCAHARAVARATHRDPRPLPRERVRPLAGPSGASRLRHARREPARDGRRGDAAPRVGSAAAWAAASTSSSCCFFLPANASRSPVPVFLLINNRPVTNTDPTRRRSPGSGRPNRSSPAATASPRFRQTISRRTTRTGSRRRHDAVRGGAAAPRARRGARSPRGRGARAG